MKSRDSNGAKATSTSPKAGRYKAPILSYFPSGLTPRPVQAQVLKELERAWDTHDVFVLNVPTAGGKTAIAQTILAWQDFASYIVPSNLLLDQCRETAPHLAYLYKREAYWCGQNEQSCESAHRKALCDECKTQRACPYRKALERAQRSTSVVCNYWTALAHGLYKNTLIIDEAHQALETLKGLATKRIWQREYNWPNTIRNLEDVHNWLTSLGGAVGEDKKLLKLAKELEATKPSTLVHRTVEDLRGNPTPVLKMIPLDVRDENPILWPYKQVRKIVLMSATIAKPDVDCMGLGNRRVKYLEVDSPIPADQRPITVCPIADMSFKNQDQAVPDVAEWLEQMIEQHEGEKGLVHAPYSLVPKLLEYLDSDRLMYHTKENKDEVYQAWRDSGPEQGMVLLCSGMYEGLDLAYDAARWQVITKVPYPSLADPGIRAKMEEDAEWYAWQTAKTIIQAAGRVCRTPTDFGQTFVVDKSFLRLYNQSRDLFPMWFTDAVTIEEEADV